MAAENTLLLIRHQLEETNQR